jgi:LmbE family N-acetylglucosaminyl deacetylase
MNYTASDIAKLGTILGIYAHPDDECWTAGGVLAAACANGQKVVCVTATRGDAGKTADEKKWPQSRLGEIRESELDDSLACLGTIEHHWFDYRDGQLNKVPAPEAVQKLTELIKKVQPDTILTFGPDGLTGHPDHQTVCAWAQAAVQATGRQLPILMARETIEKYQSCGKALHAAANVYFAISEPVTVPAAKADVYFALPPDIYQKKIASLQAHKSQMTGLFAHPQGGPALREYAKTEAFVKA